MRKWLDGIIVDVQDDEIVDEEIIEPEIDQMTEVQLALAEIYELILGGSNNG